MPYLVDTGSSDVPARQIWKKEVRDAMRQGQQLLSSTTSFPRAGTINLPVIRFTEACVALADISTPLAKDVVAVLYWAQTLTFQSQSILRHLTRLLAESGSYTDAKRTFELYVQIVLKDRETKQPEISLQLKRRPTEGSPAHPDDIAREAEEAEDESGPEAESRKAQFAEAESDSNADFVRTLVVGSRLLLKDLSEVEEAWRFANLAGKVVMMSDQRGKGIPLSLRAEVAECKGVVRMAMAMSSDMPDVDATNRASYQSEAINHLRAATSLVPKSASPFYHLAYCLGEAREIEKGVEAVQTALELDDQNVQSWHLLALLLTASGDWEGAAKACEAGVRVWDEDELNNADEIEELPSGNPSEGEPAIGSKDFAASKPATLPADNAPSSPIVLRSGAIRARAPYKPPPPTRSKKLENVIRLRITYKVIVEKTQGQETAMEEAEDLFAFFSARSGNNRASYGYRKGLSQGLGESMASVRDLGGSYVSVADLQSQSISQGTGPRGSMISVQAPTPTTNEFSEEPSQITVTRASSPGGSPGDSDIGDMSEKEKTETLRKSSLHRTVLETRLHVPPSRHTSLSRPSSIRRLVSGSTSTPDLSLPRDRTFSVGSTAALSLAPTQALTVQSRAPTRPPSPTQATGNEHGRTPTESRILSGLWLQSAATYRRWGKIEQCLVSIQEAEVIDPENPDVWVQLGLLHRTTSPDSSPDPAISALTKAVLLRPDYPAAIVSLSKIYLATDQVELAHSMLFQLTQGNGWDVPEAWYYLGKACEAQGRKERAKECFLYALELEKTRPCRTWAEAVDRWL